MELKLKDQVRGTRLLVGNMAQKQVCGGGSYKQGCGFAFGVDRLMLLY